MRTLTVRHGLAAVLAFGLLALAPARAAAQEDPEVWVRAPPSHHALGLSAGIGMVNALADASGSGEGAYLVAEYVYRPGSWFSPRLYGGLVIAPAQSDCGTGVSPCDVSAHHLFAGAKVRLLLPIPWFGPFFELGFGGAAGHFSTRVGRTVDTVLSGVTYEIPVTFGLAFGPRHEYELALQSLFRPGVDQLGGGFGFGVRIPLD